MPGPAIIAPHRPQPVPTAFDRLTVDEYLALDASSHRKWEFYRGSIRAMAGASVKHAQIVSNVGGLLLGGLTGGSCQTYFSDVRVAVSEAAYYYPDIVVVCEPPDLTDTRPEALRNPAAIVEVLSPSTEEKDRGEKLSAYREIASLHTCVLVSQSEARCEVWERVDEQRWTFKTVSGRDATLALEALGVDLPLAQVYRNVEFDQRYGDGV
jgi:Uma2 family endonuclease